jgi:predicted XRE-type DNA-binding protein
MAQKDERPNVVESSGNVFADLELPEADELLAKAKLAKKIGDIIKGRRLSQVQAAEVLGTTQPKVSNLINGRLQGFSMERLLRFLNAFDRDVQIVIKPRSSTRRRARFTVELS